MVLELKALESNFNDDYLQNTGKNAQPLYVSLHLPFKKKGGDTMSTPLWQCYHGS